MVFLFRRYKYLYGNNLTVLHYSSSGNYHIIRYIFKLLKIEKVILFRTKNNQPNIIKFGPLTEKCHKKYNLVKNVGYLFKNVCWLKLLEHKSCGIFKVDK